MMRRLSVGWNDFWFTPQAVTAVNVPRTGLCLVAAIWFASFWPHLDAWFSADGLLPGALAGRLIEFDQASGWRSWSPLWLTDSLVVVQLWVVSGTVIAVIAATGVGGRLSLSALLFWIVAWGHRIAWLEGPLEPALPGCIGYLIVQPGSTWWNSQAARHTASWTAGLALRLIQTHWWLLVAAGLMSQMAGLIWWRGEGVWWLAAAGKSHLLSKEALDGQAALTNALSHGVVLAQLLALWLVTVRAARPIGLGCALVVSLIYALVADHVLYAALLAGCATAFACYRSER